MEGGGRDGWMERWLDGWMDPLNLLVVPSISNKGSY